MRRTPGFPRAVSKIFFMTATSVASCFDRCDGVADRHA
jgi:hypothetical protein